MSAMSAMVAVAPGVQAKFGAKSNTVKARRAVVVAAVTEPEAIVADKPKKDKSEFKKKFVKKNVTVQDADIVIGASFPGKVKRVQEYGCFVDFGAKNDGLVHISELTDGFVENVADVVSQDQDVVVYVKSIDSEKGRISLTMKTPPSPEDMAANLEKEQEREAKFQERKTQKKQAEAAMSKLKNIKKGQQIDGVVKSVQPFGAFVEIQDGIEGLVHVTEMSDDYNIEVADFVKEGQTVSVRIIGIDGGKIKLSMKEKLDLKEMVKGIQTESTAGVMEVAFKTKGVTPAQFPGFDALEKAQAAAATAAAAAETAAAPVKEEAAPEPAAEAVAEVAEAVVEPEAEPVTEAVAEPVAEAVAEPEAAKEEPVATTAAPAPVEATKEAPKQTQKKDETAVPAASTTGITAAQVKSVREKSGAGMMDCKKALGECGGDEEEALVWLRKKGIASADKKASRIAAEGAVGSYIHAGARLGVICEVNCETDFVARGDRFKELVADMAMQIAACPDIEYVSPDDVDPAMVAAEREVQMKMEDMLSKPENIREKIVQGRLDKMVNEKALLKQDFIRDNAKTVEDVIKEVTAELGEKISIRRFVKYTLGEGMEKREEDFAAEVEAQTKALKAESDAKKAEPKEEPKEEEQKEETAKPTIAITAKQVKEVRDKSGAGMMDCKKALGECDGNAEEALIWLRKKGIASADKKASRIAAEGAVGSYIHAGARLGVLVEVNCETDFVARGDRFKALIADIAMQVAACPDIEYISPDDVDPAMVAAEREVQMKMEDMLSKPENIREKIVQGRLDKMVNEKALLKQDFIRDNAKTVEDVIKEATAEIGEKISIRRFTKYKLGEGIEKKNEDFAAEVAAQMRK